MISLYIVDTHISRNVVGMISPSPSPPPGWNSLKIQGCTQPYVVKLPKSVGARHTVIEQQIENQIWHWPTISLHVEHSKNVSSNQPSGFFKVWTFFRCFDRDLRELKQNNKFDTDQLFYYILNIQRMCLQTCQVISSKFGLSFHVLTEICERWSRITNLTLTNCFVT